MSALDRVGRRQLLDRLVRARRGRRAVSVFHRILLVAPLHNIDGGASRNQLLRITTTRGKTSAGYEARIFAGKNRRLFFIYFPFVCLSRVYYYFVK